MNYPDGTVIVVGDVIWWNEGGCIGRVACIVDTPDSWISKGLAEPGIFICNDLAFDELTCDVFNSEAQFLDEGIGKLSCDEMRGLTDAIAASRAAHPESSGDSSIIVRIKVKKGS